jgi:hypothetical protein
MFLVDRCRALSLAPFAALLVACGSEPAPAGEAALPAGAPLRFAATPRVSIGVIEGDTLQQFQRIVTPFLLSNGLLAVPDAGAMTIRVFQADGDHVITLGGEGEGPGEFRMLTAAWARGDTIEAYDPRVARITRFAPDGSVETVSVSGGRPVADAAIPAPLADGWAVYGVRVPAPGRRDSLTVSHVSRSGEVQGELGWTEGFLRFAALDLGGPVPLSPKPLFAAAGGRVYIGDAMLPRVRVIEPGGAPLPDIAWQPGPQPSVDETLRTVIDTAVARAPGDRFAGRAYLEAAPVPQQLPVYWGMIADSEGFLWIRPYEPLEHAAALGGLRNPGEGGRWIVFAPDGSQVTEIDVPADLQPVSITRDAVVGIHRDDLDVESVRVYALERS